MLVLVLVLVLVRVLVQCVCVCVVRDLDQLSGLRVLSEWHRRLPERGMRFREHRSRRYHPRREEQKTLPAI